MLVDPLKQELAAMLADDAELADDGVALNVESALDAILNAEAAVEAEEIAAKV